ncbi:MAG: hypothetical protein ACK5OC_13855, partial [Pirellula sp.]
MSTDSQSSIKIAGMVQWVLIVLCLLILFVLTECWLIGSLDAPVPLFASWTIAFVHLVATVPLGIVLATTAPLGTIPMLVRWVGATIASVLFWIVALVLSDATQKFPIDYWMLWAGRV